MLTEQSADSSTKTTTPSTQEAPCSKETSQESLGKSLGVSGVAAVIGKGISFSRGIVLARLLTPVELGVWSLIIHGTQVGAVAIGFGLPALVLRYTSRFQAQGRLRQLIGQSIAITSLISVLVFILGWLFRDELGWLLLEGQASATTLGLILVGMVGTLAWSLSQSVIQGLRQFQLNAILSMAFSVAFLILMTGLLAVFGPSASWCAVAYAICTWGTVVASWLLTRTRFQSDSPTEQIPDDSLRLKSLSVFAYGYWIAGLLTVVWKSLDRFMVLHLGSVSETESLSQLGDYFVVQKLAEPILLIAATFAGVLTSYSARLWDSSNTYDVKRMFCLTTKLTFLGVTFAGSLAIALMPWALQIFVGRVGDTISGIVVPSTLSVICLSVFFLLRPFLLCSQRTSRLAFVWGLSVGMNAILNWMWVPHSQVVGAANATAVSAGIVVFGTLCLAWADGFKLKARSYWVVLTPFCLLLPPLWQFVLLVVVAAMSYFVFDRDERLVISHAMQSMMRRLLRIRRAKTVVRSSIASIQST